MASSVLSDLRKSLISSSNLFLGLPTALQVLYFMLSSGFHPAAFAAHLSSGHDAILIASLHFILLCALIQRWMFTVFIRSTASSVLLQFLLSSVSFMKEVSLS